MTRKQLVGTSKATSSRMLPRNIKQIQNMCHEKSSSLFTSLKDVLATLMEHCKITPMALTRHSYRELKEHQNVYVLLVLR